MSIKQEKITELKVIAVKYTVKCDGCGDKMMEETVNTNFYDPGEDLMPSVNLLSGWIEIVKGAYGNRTKAHSCPRCVERSVAALLEHA